MYYYIIDPQKINQKHFERVQNQLYSCLSEHRINGEVTRVTSLRTVSQLVETALMRGATTIVAVGHDNTVQEIINAVGENEIVIGYVPLEESEISKVIGVTDVASACKSLAQRRIEILDLGRVQYNYFFTKISIGTNLEELIPKSVFDFSKFGHVANLKAVPMKMEVDGEYSAEFEVAIGGIFNSRAVVGNNRVADPTDGVLDVLLLPGLSSFDAWKYRNDITNGTLEKIPGCAVVHGKKITISSPEGLPFYVGDKTVAKAPCNIEVIPKKVRMIVGKDRTF
jgi:diacylglycerol kinase (ATP)